ncbi:MAG: protein kinase [Anaerolineales bacterium]|nr:protein kinase [Anaerolineales bacterium]MCX7609456.1 protein kinase [Anaerolineales bacterium]
MMLSLSLEGKTLGKYRILEPLGRGGMAQVYKAYHPHLDRYVAIKVLRSDLTEDKEFLARFQREARAVASLRHPNIIQIFDFDVENDWYYMVMELLEGDTLKSYLNVCRASGEHIPLGDVVRILNDVLSGLAYAHAQGIIHRDLKPSNILLTRNGQAVLTDFGIAQIVGGTQYTVAGVLMGTLPYMSPEQGRDGKCDQRSDIYSLGIMLYEMLTGRVPFDAETPLAILLKHLTEPVIPPRQYVSGIPAVFEQVVLKALAKNPDERYQSASEMSDALMAAAQECGIEVPPTTRLPQTISLSPAPTKRVDVFSGAQKSTLQDQSFASGDTEVMLQSLSSVHELRSQSIRGVLTGLTLFVLGNILLLWAGGVFGWETLAHAWPLELLLVGIFFFLFLIESSNVWLLIPAGLTWGNGILLSYFSLTGRWIDWTLLWPLEPLFIASFTIAPFWLRRKPDGGRAFIRWLGGGALLGGGIIFFLVAAAAILKSL